ncbi:heparinase II/III domain-containing protein [Sphingobacterium sp. WOUb80]|uniref:heparinase II/III domain-containing protein n=1 Tax=Sphingobacterium sp. WOUb80 TaxID=3234028 RepID=UPI003CE8308C
MIFTLKIYFDTIRHLKLSQLFWQLRYKIRAKQFLKNKYFNNLYDEFESLSFVNTEILYKKNLLIEPLIFKFLNLEKKFVEKINWNFSEYGKLWNYNLEYFDYLHQQDISIEERIKLINDFYNYSLLNKRTLEPYPVSLRSINIIKFSIRDGILDKRILNFVYQELSFLDKNYEFQILGNHLLENAFALSLGGAFFKREDWLNKGIRILYKELKEQILEDGAHFELSPMYHQIILFRVLELIDWYQNYGDKDANFLSFFRDIASKMRSWAGNIQFANGDIPLFNDSAKGIAYDIVTLNDYANILGIESKNLPLGQSGYRSFLNSNYEIKIDLAQIGASYQPGHAHADALSFILYSQELPLIVEQGTSTYQIGKRRNLERSTEAHNTIVLNGRDQSEVWGGFRVGKRAKTTIHYEGQNGYTGSHNGYKNLGIIHTRSFIFEEAKIQITDTLSQNGNAKAYVHLHPDRRLSKINDKRFIIDDMVTIDFDGAETIVSDNYEYADSYNQYRPAIRFVISFERELSTTIFFKHSR